MKPSKLLFFAMPLLLLTLGKAAADEHDGRYIAVPNGSGAGIWVLDSRTGRVKLCYVSGAQRSYLANCTNWTDGKMSTAK